MNLFKKIFNSKKETSQNNEQNVKKFVDIDNLSLDEIFVHNFIKKGGKFLYCSNQEEVNKNLVDIVDENKWQNIVCVDSDLEKLLTIIGKNSTTKVSEDRPFFTRCEHLISDNGSVLFSSNQVQQFKISKLPSNFIVLATMSQLVRNTSESLMAIRKNYQKNYPTNISAIKSFMPNKVDEDFLSYGNNNAKNLYLLLLEDL